MKQKQTTIIAMLAIAVVLLILANLFHGIVRFVFYGLAVFAAVMFVVLWAKIWRCPHCGQHLGRMSTTGDTCPHCKQKLE